MEKSVLNFSLQNLHFYWQKTYIFHTFFHIMALTTCERIFIKVLKAFSKNIKSNTSLLFTDLPEITVLILNFDLKKLFYAHFDCIPLSVTCHWRCNKSALLLEEKVSARQLARLAFIQTCSILFVITSRDKRDPSW